MSEISEMPKEGALVFLASALAGAWGIIRRKEALKPLRHSIEGLREEQALQAISIAEMQGQAIPRAEFQSAIEKIFNKLDQNREHYDDQFRDLSLRVDKLIDRRP